MIRSPLFIVFEGIDGSGKSTQSDLLFNYLTSIDIPCKSMMEPTEGEWGCKIREMLKGDIIPAAEEQLRLFLLDREDDVQNNIIPALNNNETIVMDRYYYSNAAYQGAMGLSPKYVLNENRKKFFPKPDRVYFIDILPEIAVERIAKRSENDKREIFEKKSFLDMVRENYLSIADNSFLIVNGSGTVDEIFKLIESDINEILKGKDYDIE